MKAVGFRVFGGPEVLEVVDLPIPETPRGHVRIRVRAASVNPSDLLTRSGARRGAIGGLSSPWVLGWDAAGTIEEVGEGVDRLYVGQDVIAVVMPVRPGAYASQIVVDAESVVAQPAGAGHAAASTLPMTGLTAMQALDRINPIAGSWLAVTGAAGILGGFLVQMGKAAGLRVIADAAPADEELVRSLGADVIVARGDDVADRIRAKVPEGVSALADAATLDERVVPAIADDGALAVFRQWDGDPGRGIEVHRIIVSDYLPGRHHLDLLRSLVDDGTLTLRVADVLPIERAHEAHRRLEAGGIRGRLVLEF